jgi:pimeloyl-ACP methyl ester carboxylesterase
LKGSAHNSTTHQPATENLTLRVTDTSVFYNDVPDDLRATAIKLIHRFPSQVLGGKQVYAPWKHVAATYIICEDDLALTPPSQEWFAGQAGGKWTVERIKAGHSPFLSQPENLAGLVIRAAEKAVAESE